jgi:hypothetical protein
LRGERRSKRAEAPARPSRLQWNHPGPLLFYVRTRTSAIRHNGLFRMMRLPSRYRDAVLGSLVFAMVLGVFRIAPVQQSWDSRYTMLLADNLLRHHDFALERYKLPESDYRLRTIRGHQYYYFPPASSLLSVPFVALMRLRGVSAVRLDGTYSANVELELDARLAAILMAAFAVLVYFTARQLLPVGWSVGVAFVSAFGTQVLSTASRSMWSDTWGIAFVGGAVFLLLQSAAGARRLNVPLLATLEAIAYVVRPTNSLVLAGTGLYFLVTNRVALWPFAATAAAWLGGFFLYSWIHFHSLLPEYFVADRLEFFAPGVAVLGNLISPGRGLLVYVPAVVAVALLLGRYRSTVRWRALATLAVFVIVSHFVVLSGFAHWWGGHSYGARLTTSLVPWFVLLAILAVDASRRAREVRPFGAADLAVWEVAGILCVASIAINAVGAFSWETHKWNVLPEDIDHDPERLWSWRSPQFLAPFLAPNGPFPLLPTEGLRLGMGAADKQLGLGWYEGEGDFRWTEGRGSSSVQFSLPAIEDGILELDGRAYLAEGKIAEQRLIVSMNGRNLAAITIRTPEFATHRIAMPAEVVKRDNVLTFGHPDAASPRELLGLPDLRVLGVAIRTIAWRSDPPASSRETKPRAPNSP